MKATTRTALSLGLITLLTLTLTPGGARSDPGLFEHTDSLMSAAEDLGAELLSPENFAAAQKYYAKAADYEARGRADRARDALEDADRALEKAIETSKLGTISFAKTLAARDAALAAEAQKYEAELWRKAEQQFNYAARRLEGGNVKSATDKSALATGYYADAELAAIKTAIVGKARALIAEADEARVYREAPISLGRAKLAVAKAESDLDDDRYATQGPIALAAKAEYEARHARYLARELRRVDEGEISGEELILSWEEPLQSIATALDVTTDMSAGHERTTISAVTMAKSLRADNAELRREASKLAARLGGSQAIVEETQRLQNQLDTVESLFAPEEARVMREGNDLVLRLVGLSFSSGKSALESRYFALLKKVQEAIEVFSVEPVVIEGHTDSVGSDAVNMKLSQERADAVREYLIANLGLRESRVTAEGFGKDKPIASNDTEAGRAQNRRIDVVIRGARARRSR